MKDIDNLCMNCFKPLTEGAVCAACEYDNDSPVDTMYLQPKTMLMEQYCVGTVITHDSDAVSYNGYDCQIGKKIIIREFYPRNMASRLDDSNDLHVRQRYAQSVEKYKQSFYTLWTTLEKIHNKSAVVPVYDVFEANNTVYAIIEHMESIPLREYLLRNENGYISWDTARLMFMPVLTTIEALHVNDIVHGSITPDNMVLCRDGKVRLGVFSIQEAADSTSDFEFIDNPGYTALEQYDNSHKISSATDIYAFSACIYRALVGTNPPDARSRETNDKLMIPNSIAEQIPMHVIKALGSGLQVYPEKRIKDINHFRELLDAAPSVKAQGTTASKYHSHSSPVAHYDYAKQQSEDARRAKRSKIVIIVLALLIALAIAAGIYLIKFTHILTPAPETTSAVEVASFEVPNFASGELTQSDVENTGAWNTQFRIEYTAEYSTEYEEGIIFKQSIAAGETVEAGTAITLTISKGIQTEVIPKVADLTAAEATEALEKLGFTVKTVEVYNDGSHKAGTVRSSYASAPAEGTSIAVGEEVVIQVYGEVQTTTTAPAGDNEN